MAIGEDWLSGDPRDPVTAQVKEAAKQKEIEFAQHYLVFVHDPRAAAILSHWDKVLRRQAVPVDSTVQRYAAANALREFIEKIHAQIELAGQG